MVRDLGAQHPVEGDPHAVVVADRQPRSGGGGRHRRPDGRARREPRPAGGVHHLPDAALRAGTPRRGHAAADRAGAGVGGAGRGDTGRPGRHPGDAERAAAAPRPGRGALSPRRLRVRRGGPTGGAHRHRPDHPGRQPTGGARRHRIGQDDPDLAPVAPARPDPRRDRDRRHRPARRHPGVATLADRRRPAGHGAVCRHHRREHRLWPSGRRDGRDRGGGGGGPDPQLHRGIAGGLRHVGGRTRRHPLRRTEAAHRHRPRAADRSAHPDPGRRHLQRGRAHRGPDPVDAAPLRRRAHHDRDRATRQHLQGRGCGRGARRRPDRRLRRP